MKIIKNCKYCNKEFLADERDLKRNRAKFCSLSCSGKYFGELKRIKITNCKCANCSLDFYKKESAKTGSKSGLFFCSRKCKDLAQRIGGIKEIQPLHYSDNIQDYHTVISRDGGKCSCEICGYNDHTEILQIHHIDRNRRNNLRNNLLVVCPNCHQWEHYKARDGLYNKLK